MEEVRTVCLRELSPHLVCVLCGGYIIQAITVQECLHSFCRSCLVRYLETSEVCPICDVTLHKVKPHQNIRDDPLLQSLIYKLVPGLFQREMKTRREFYESHVKEPNSDDSSDSDSSSQEDFLAFNSGDLQGNVYPDVISPDSEVSLCIQLSDRPPPYKHRPLKKLKVKDASVLDRRFLLCPATFPIRLLKKFIQGKFDLSDKQEISVYFTEERLSDACTLMDVCYIYRWNKMAPLQLFYTVTDSTLGDDQEKLTGDKQSQHSVKQKPVSKTKSHDKDVNQSQPVNRDSELVKRKSVSGKSGRNAKVLATASERSPETSSKTESPRSKVFHRTATKKVVSQPASPIRNAGRMNTNVRRVYGKRRHTKEEERRSSEKRNVVRSTKPKKTDAPSLKGNESETEEHDTCHVMKDSDAVEKDISDMDSIDVQQSGEQADGLCAETTEPKTQSNGSQGKSTDVSSATADTQSDKVTGSSGDNVNKKLPSNSEALQCVKGDNSEDKDKFECSTELDLDNSSRTSKGEEEAIETAKIVDTKVPQSCHELSLLQAQQHDSVRQGKGKLPLKMSKDMKSVKQTRVEPALVHNSSNESDSDHPAMEICTDIEDNVFTGKNMAENNPNESIIHSILKCDNGTPEDEKQVNLNLLADAATLSSKAEQKSLDYQNKQTDQTHSIDIQPKPTDSTEDKTTVGNPFYSSCSEPKQCNKGDNGNKDNRNDTPDIHTDVVPSTNPSMCQYTESLQNDDMINQTLNQTNITDNGVKVLNPNENTPRAADNYPRPSVSSAEFVIGSATSTEQAFLFRPPAVQVKSVEVQTEGSDMEKSAPILCSVFAKTSNYRTDIESRNPGVGDVLLGQKMVEESHNDITTSNIKTSLAGVSEKLKLTPTHTVGSFSNLAEVEPKDQSQALKQYTNVFGSHTTKVNNTSSQLNKAVRPSTTGSQIDEKVDAPKQTTEIMYSHSPDRSGTNRRGDHSPSEGKKNSISFAKKYRCPARLGRTENKSQTFKGDKSKMSRKSSSDNSDPYIFTADDNHNYVNGASPNSSDTHSPNGSTRNALAFLEEYVNYVHSSQHDEELSNQPNLSKRAMNQSLVTSHNKVEDNTSAGHVILGTITLPRAYIPLKDIASAAALQKRKSKNEQSTTLSTSAKPQQTGPENTVNVLNESEDQLRQEVTVDGKKIPPLKLKLQKKQKNQKGSPTKRTISTKVNKSSKKTSPTTEKPVGDLNTDQDEGHPRIFLRISKANIPPLNRSLSATDTRMAQAELGQQQHNMSPTQQCAETKLPSNQTVASMATISADTITKTSVGETKTLQTTISDTCQVSHSMLDVKSQSKDTQVTSTVKCVQPAKIRSKIQRSRSLPNSIKDKNSPEVSSVTTSHSTPLVTPLATGTKSNFIQNQEYDNTKTGPGHGDGKSSPMKGTRVLKSSVTVVSTYSSTPGNSSDASPTETLAKQNINTSARGKNLIANNGDHHKTVKDKAPQSIGKIKPANNTTHANVKANSQTGGVVFSVAPSLFINASSTMPTVLSLAEIQALNQYLSSTNTAIAVSTGQIVTNKVQSSANTLPSQVVTSAVSTELASTTQIVQMLLSTPPIRTSVIPSQTSMTQQSNTTSKNTTNYANVGNITSVGGAPHLISIQGGRHVSPISVNQQQPSVSGFPFPAATMKLPLPVKRKLPTINPIGPRKIIRLPVQARLNIPDSQKTGISAVFTAVPSQPQGVSSIPSSTVATTVSVATGKHVPISTVKDTFDFSAVANQPKVNGTSHVGRRQQGSNITPVVTVSPCDVTILGKVEHLVNTSSVCTTMSTIPSSTTCKTTASALQPQFVALLPKCSSQNPSNCPGHQPNFKMLNSMLTTTVASTKTEVSTSPQKNMLTKSPPIGSDVQLPTSAILNQKQVNRNKTRHTHSLQDQVPKCSTNHSGQTKIAKLCSGTSTTMSPVTVTQSVQTKPSTSVPSISAACSIRLISLLNGENSTNVNPSSGISSTNLSSIKTPNISKGYYVQPNTYIPSSTSAATYVPVQVSDKPTQGIFQTTSAMQMLSPPSGCTPQTTVKAGTHLIPAFTGFTGASSSSVTQINSTQTSLPQANTAITSNGVSNSLVNNLQTTTYPNTAAPAVSSLLPQVYLGARHFLPPHISYHGIVYPGNGIVMVNGQPRLMASQQAVAVTSGQQIHTKIPVKRSHSGEVKPTGGHLPANGYDAPLELTTKKYNVDPIVLEK